MQSFCIPFHCLRDVKLEQPIFGANYLKGDVLAQPGGNWEGDTTFKLTFNQGGCIEFGQALLRAADLGTSFLIHEGRSETAYSFLKTFVQRKFYKIFFFDFMLIGFYQFGSNL